MVLPSSSWKPSAHATCCVLLSHRQSDSDRLPVPKLQPTRTVTQYMYGLSYKSRSLSTDNSSFRHYVNRYWSESVTQPHLVVFGCSREGRNEECWGFIYLPPLNYRSWISAAGNSCNALMFKLSMAAMILYETRAILEDDNSPSLSTLLPPSIFVAVLINNMMFHTILRPLDLNFIYLPSESH